MLLNSDFSSQVHASLAELENIYEIKAYEKNDILNFIRMLAVFIAYKEGDSIDNQLYTKLHQWFQGSLKLQAEVKILKQVATIMTMLAANKTGMTKAKREGKFTTLLKALRGEIMNKDKKANRTKLFETAQISRPQITLINNIFGIINSNADSGYNGLNRNISILGDATLNQYFFPEIDENATQIVKTYLKVLKKITGTNLPYMTKQFKDEEFPKLSTRLQNEYKAAAKAEAAAYQKARFNIIRNSGEILMDADELKEKLEAEGMLTWRIPEGFDGKINDKGNLFLHDGRQLNRDQIGGTMEMLPEKEGRAKLAHGQGFYDKQEHDFQPLEKAQKSAEGKFELVNNILPRLKEFADKWRADFVYETKQQKLLGAMAETFYTTAGRIGSERKDGLSTLKSKNVIIQGNSIKISYVGKDNVQQTHVIKPTNPVTMLLIEYFKELKSQKGPNDYWWSDNGVSITANDFRDYLKEGNAKRGITGIEMGISPHKFRHIRGTDMFNRTLKANPIPKNATTKEIELHLQEILGAIGQQLGHIRTNKTTGKAEPTWRTAVKSYVDPSSVRKVFLDRDKPIPTWVPKAIEGKEDDDD